MKTFTTLSLISAMGLMAASSASAALSTVADYTFDDASSLAPFTQSGDPTVSGGQLELDGDDFLTIADPLSGVTSDYVVEAIVTADSFDSFDFAFGRNDPGGANSGNNGQGLLFQDFGGGPGQISALNSFSGFATSTVQLAPATPTAVAIVQDGTTTRLFVNGTEVATTTAAIVGTPTTLGIGTHPFDGAAGAFNGSIDRVRLSTFNAGEFDSADLLPVPEPSSLALLGLSGLLVARRRRA